MKKFLSILIFFPFIALLSCEGKKEESGNPGFESSEIESDTSTAASSEVLSPKFKLLVKSDQGIIRNVDFGTNLATLSTLEDTSALVEKTSQYYNYSIHLDSLEEGEVLYYFGEDNVINKIEVNIYPNSPKSRTELFQEFTKYFNKKYGVPYSEIEEVKIWRGNDKNILVEMRMLGNSKVHDIQIDFKKINENT